MCRHRYAALGKTHSELRETTFALTCQPQSWMLLLPLAQHYWRDKNRKQSNDQHDVPVVGQGQKHLESEDPKIWWNNKNLLWKLQGSRVSWKKMSDYLVFNNILSQPAAARNSWLGSFNGALQKLVIEYLLLFKIKCCKPESWTQSHNLHTDDSVSLGP